MLDCVKIIIGFRHSLKISQCNSYFRFLQPKHVAGVVENTSRLREERLVTSRPRDEFPVRFTSLPPLKHTPLVNTTPVDDGKDKRAAVITKSGVPQVWR